MTIRSERASFQTHPLTPNDELHPALHEFSDPKDASSPTVPARLSSRGTLATATSVKLLKECDGTLLRRTTSKHQGQLRKSDITEEPVFGVNELGANMQNRFRTTHWVQMNRVMTSHGSEGDKSMEILAYLPMLSY